MILWARVIDRINMVSVLSGLSPVHLSSMLSRLGYSHVLRAVGPPFGCRLSFTVVGDPDQAAAARHVCKMAAEAQKVRVLPPCKRNTTLVVQPSLAGGPNTAGLVRILQASCDAHPSRTYVLNNRTMQHREGTLSHSQHEAVQSRV